MAALKYLKFWSVRIYLILISAYLTVWNIDTLIDYPQIEAQGFYGI